jgi:hypothetical protein
LERVQHLNQDHRPRSELLTAAIRNVNGMSQRVPHKPLSVSQVVVVATNSVVPSPRYRVALRFFEFRSPDIVVVALVVVVLELRQKWDARMGMLSEADRMEAGALGCAVGEARIAPAWRESE